VLTLFAVPKPFVGEIAAVQSAAIASWIALREDVQVVLVGDEPGVEAAARKLGAEHVPDVARNEYGTPLLDDAFVRVDRIARLPWRCLVNADVVLGPDLLATVERLTSQLQAFLLVGQARDLDRDLVDPDPVRARSVALQRGTLRGVTALDWFVFPEGHFDPIPPFAVGRAGFDNWLLWRGRQTGPVIDATGAVVAIHLTHGYDHVAGGKEAAYYGPEAARNVALAGGTRHVYTLHDATHVVQADGSLRRNYGALLRWRETVRKVAWKLGRR
jgi:hypothetical protein